MCRWLTYCGEPIYLDKVLHGDFGNSVISARPVLEDLKRVFPATLELSTAATLIGVLFGVPLGIFAAVNQGRLIWRAGGGGGHDRRTSPLRGGLPRRCLATYG